MKRSLITTLIIGAAVVFSVGTLHFTKSLARLETVAAQLVSDYAGATRIVSEKWQYLFILLAALIVAWLNLSIAPRWRSRLLVGLLLVELFGLSWVCSLYRIFFQPIPSVLALIFALAIAEGWSVFLRRDRSHLVRTFFANRLSKNEFRRLKEGATRFDPQPKTYETSVVVCDIGNRLAFAEDSEPAAFAEVTAKFIRETAEHLVNEGAYLHAADGEGVVAIFGFPVPNTDHTQKAVRVVLDMIKNFRERRQDSGETVCKWGMRAGVSSGALIAGALKDTERPLLLAGGEPIDIYEPLWLAVEAKPERVARRDAFWNGVVLYREKRWAEAYSEFQKARASEDENDPPLQFYLRRLEPLLLQLAETPLE